MNELLITARAVHFGSCMTLLGAFAVRLLVERPAAEARQGAGRLAGWCLAAAVGSGFGWFWAAAAGMNGSGLREALDVRLLGMVLTQTAWGQVWMVRCGLGVVVGGVLCFSRQRWSWRVAVLPAAAFVGSIAWLGHAGASEGAQRPLMLTADVAHLLAVSAWPGGLAPFGLLLGRLMKAGGTREAYVAARRFSAMSLVAVGCIATSGLVDAFFLVGSFRALVGTDYGRLLIVKLALFAVTAALGAWNLLVHEPRLETDADAAGAMRRKVWIEVALGTLIVLVVAIMGTLPPGTEP